MLKNNPSPDQLLSTKCNRTIEFDKDILSEFNTADDEILAVVVSDNPTENTFYDGSVLTVDVETLDTNDHDSKGGIYAYHDLTKGIATSLGSFKTKAADGSNVLMGKGKYIDVQFVRDIRSYMEAGLINCVSIGISWKYGMAEHDEDERTLLIKHASMYEWSVLPGWTQANKDAVIKKFSQDYDEAKNISLNDDALDAMFPSRFLHDYVMEAQKELDKMGHKVLDLEKAVKELKKEPVGSGFKDVILQVDALTELLNEFKTN